MHSILVAIAQWLEGTPWGVSARESNYVYPFVQLTHFTGLSIWLGTNFALDLRLLGVGSKRSTAAQVADSLFVWNWIGFCIVLLGGFTLFSALATSFIGQHRVPMEAGILRSAGAGLAHLGAAEGARLGKNDGDPRHRQACRGH